MTKSNLVVTTTAGLHSSSLAQWSGEGHWTEVDKIPVIQVPNCWGLREVQLRICSTGLVRCFLALMFKVLLRNLCIPICLQATPRWLRSARLGKGEIEERDSPFVENELLGHVLKEFTDPDGDKISNLSTKASSHLITFRTYKTKRERRASRCHFTAHGPSDDSGLRNLVACRGVDIGFRKRRWRLG